MGKFTSVLLLPPIQTLLRLLPDLRDPARRVDDLFPALFQRVAQHLHHFILHFPGLLLSNNFLLNELLLILKIHLGGLLDPLIHLRLREPSD